MHLYPSKLSVKWPCFWATSCTGCRGDCEFSFFFLFFAVDTFVYQQGLWPCDSIHVHTLFWWPLSLLLFLCCVWHMICVCIAFDTFGYIPPVSSSSHLKMGCRILFLFILCLVPEMPQHQQCHSSPISLSLSASSDMSFLLLFSISSVPSPSVHKGVKV